MHALVLSMGARHSSVPWQVVSNHGNDAFTCLYRVRIHGTPAYGGDQQKEAP